MNISDNDSDLIKRYLKGSITALDEKKMMEKLKDSMFRKEMLYQAELIDALAIAEEQAIKDQLLSLKDNASSQATKSKPAVNKLTKLLLVIGLLLALLFGANKLLDQTDGSKYQHLAEVYATPYPPKDIYRGEGELSGQNESAESQAMHAYSGKEYDKALALFMALKPQTDERQLYIASCHLASDKFLEAKNLFETLTKSSDTNISQNAEWYYAICELGINNQKSAKMKLVEMSHNSEHIFSKKAIKLLEAMKEK